MFHIQNRRYIGSKFKLLDWIFLNLPNNVGVACDIFAGSGVVANEFIANSNSKKIIINDFLYSNEIIYNAFFNSANADCKILNKIKDFYNTELKTEPNYFSDNFSDKFFSANDCLKIGTIREHILSVNLSNIEKNILLASLIYSMDKIANTVGHFEAYRKREKPQDKFKFELIKPTKNDKEIEIYRSDSNALARQIKADLVFVDPPYNSRQYSRFYHVYENLVQWQKPKLSGVALKQKEENMSEYCRISAPNAFADLIKNLNCRYIAVTYNNTYTSKSSSSRNKISFDEICDILSDKGKLEIKEKNHAHFNAGKSDLKGHKEFLFLVRVVK
ncbi:DNA adenine methylase [Campylobacter fetus]|uniref:DNA adenine methylase n=1 Tax=Campylobacter fetus TaxID=196 RepID=UPI000AE604D7